MTQRKVIALGSVWIIAVVSVLALVGCVSRGQQIKGINRTVNDIRTTVKSIYGIAHASQNERELITGPLKVDPNDKTPSAQLMMRAYARIVIINDRRPYNILVEAYIERRTTSGTFVEVGLSESVSQDLAKELHRALLESRENWNVIDDFRAF